MISNRNRKKTIYLAGRKEICVALTLAICLGMAAAQGQLEDSASIPPVPKGRQYEEPQIRAAMVQATKLIRAEEARDTFGVSGKGLTVAIIDTGLRTTHEDFTGRVLSPLNYTADNKEKDNASDGNGHGTHVAGIVAADKVHHGIAPGARVIPIKALDNSGRGVWPNVVAALQWVIDNQKTYQISVVNLSFGDEQCYTDDTKVLYGNGIQIQKLIKQLRDADVAVVVAAGNVFNGREGMGFPAILRETVSVGAVFNATLDPSKYKGDHLTSFSQRLHEATPLAECRTDVFAPGSSIASSGNLTDTGENIYEGTSQAAPITAGVILLLQEYYSSQSSGRLPKVDDIERWLRKSAVQIIDESGKKNKTFCRIDALGALLAMNDDFYKVLEMQPAQSAAVETKDRMTLKKAITQLSNMDTSISSVVQQAGKSEMGH